MSNIICRYCGKKIVGHPFYNLYNKTCNWHKNCIKKWIDEQKVDSMDETPICYNCKYKERDADQPPCRRCGVLNGFVAPYDISWEKEDIS